MGSYLPPTAMPVPVAVPVKAPPMVVQGMFGLGLVLALAGVCIMGFTLYGTQRTTAQILLKQPAAVQNPAKGLKLGGSMALAGGALLGVAYLAELIARKLGRH